MNEIFLKRQSKRSFLPGKVPQNDVEAMLNALRWAPSPRNEQPWRIVVVEELQKLEPALSRGNAAWATKAPLAFVISGYPDPTLPPEKKDKFPFEVGMATENLILQAFMLGYQASPTGGWDENRVKEILHIPPEAKVLCIVFVGKPGDPSALDEISRAKDERPRTRKELNEIAYTEQWGNALTITN